MLALERAVSLGIFDCIRARVTVPARRRILLCLAVAVAGLFTGTRDAPAAARERVERPNVLVILADDLGFSDLGCFGGEIETPRLDALAAGGLRFSQFYNTARCWPTRASLLTGYYAQQVRRDTVPGVVSGARGERPAWAPLLPALLQPLGYRAYHSGKWHLDSMPLATGFDRSYYLRDQGRFFHPQVHFEDDRPLPPVEPDRGYYATTAIADHAIRCLQDHAANHADRPFFHFLAFTAPHFPLHAPADDVARYRTRYQRDWSLVRAERWERQEAMELVDGTLSEVEREVGPPYHFPDALETLGDGEINRPLPWQELTSLQRDFQSAKMAVHAAMIDRMDHEIGRVLDQLQAMGAFENTLVFFLSDNGASAEIMVRADGHDPQAMPGSAASYLCLGPGWSTVANTPFRRHKTWVHEGGIATPLIVHWPCGLTARGELRRTPGHVIDFVPTILAAARSSDADQPPAATGDDTERLGPARPGKNLLPVFARDQSVEREDLWWLHEGNRAIRVGDWKLVAARDEPWELFDLSVDRTETNDLAKQHPDRVQTLSDQWKRRMAEFTAVAQ